MGDFIYWVGQFTLLAFELIGMILIIALPMSWLVGAFLEIGDWLFKKYINIKGHQCVFDKDKRKEDNGKN